MHFSIIFSNYSLSDQFSHGFILPSILPQTIETRVTLPCVLRIYVMLHLVISHHIMFYHVMFISIHYKSLIDVLNCSSISSYYRPFLHDLNGEVIIFSTESFEELRLNEVKLKLPSELMSFMISEDSSSLNFDNNESFIQGRNVPKNIPENVRKNIPENVPQNIPENTSADSCDSDKNIPVDLGTQNLEVKDIVDNSSPSTYGLFVQDLYFVTKNGSMDSIHSKAMSWALNKISCETEFDNDLNNETAVENLRLRVEARYPHLMATYDLIQMYSTCTLADQLFVVTEESK
jgi:hypothetical protein